MMLPGQAFSSANNLLNRAEDATMYLQQRQISQDLKVLLVDPESLSHKTGSNAAAQMHRVLLRR